MEEDVVELGGEGWSPRLPGRRPSRGRRSLVAAALVAAVVGGYAVHARGAAAPRPQPGPTVAADAAAVHSGDAPFVWVPTEHPCHNAVTAVNERKAMLTGLVRH